MFARAESFSTQHPLYFVTVRCCQRSWGNPGQDHEIEVFLEGHHFIFWMSESHMNYNTKHLSEQFQNASFRYTILSPASVLRRDNFLGRGFEMSMPRSITPSSNILFVNNVLAPRPLFFLQDVCVAVGPWY